MSKALVVNLIGGPGCGKSVTAAQLFANLKKTTKYKIEYFQEYVKPLVWKAEDTTHMERSKNAIEELNNQRSISNNIYQLLKIMSSQLDIIITDGSIFHGLHYNRVNIYNTSNQDKTETFIIDKFNEFNNLNILLNRGNITYEQEGRQQTYDEALYADIQLEFYLKKYNIPYNTMVVDNDADLLDMIKLYMKNDIKK